MWEVGTIEVVGVVQEDNEGSGERDIDLNDCHKAAIVKAGGRGCELQVAPSSNPDELETASAGITAVNSATTVLVKRLRMVVRGSWAVNRYTTGKSINDVWGTSIS